MQLPAIRSLDLRRNKPVFSIIDGWLMWPLPGMYADWCAVGMPSPYSFKRVEIIRDGWDSPITVNPNDRSEGWKATNIVGLYWRKIPAGEEKDE